MTVITFDDNLITGNKTIDEQHKELIDRIQQFVSACESEDARVKAIKMLDYLDEYTEFHFKEEEKLQKDVGYPGLEEHIKKHEERPPFPLSCVAIDITPFLSFSTISSALGVVYATNSSNTPFWFVSMITPFSEGIW